jgi:hypothetical protein
MFLHIDNAELHNLVLTAKEKKTHPHLNVRHYWIILCFDELVLARVDYRQRFLKI